MKTPHRIDTDDLPFKRFRTELDGMFQRFFDDPFLTNKTTTSDITPACNIAEKKDHYTIEVEIPGVNPDDIDIDLEGNMLKIKGERKQSRENEDEETQIHSVEHEYGTFYRSFTLPEGIKEEEITAHNDNGILFIVLPKSKENKARKIQINKK